MSTARFNADCKRFLVGMTEDNKKLFKRTAEQIKHSITDGSPATGAPGQPVDTGYLKGSWQIAWNAEGEWTAQVGTNCAYARVIESGGNKAEYDPSGTTTDEFGVKGGQIGPALGPVVNVGRKHRKSTVGGAHSWEQTRVNFDRLVDNVRAELGQ